MCKTSNSTDDLFDQTVTFEQLGLRHSVCQGLTRAGYEQPTSIQAKLIRPILEGKDVIGQARTGTGKTAAFGLPLLHLADEQTRFQALILTPTRELAAQVAAEVNELGHHTPIRTACIIGGESMQQQTKSVQRGGHLVVGTPGRIMDLHARKQIHFQNIRFVVLDEVDRMLDIGFRDDIKKILGSIKTDHQIIFVSATIGPDIERLARTFMTDDAEKITTVAGSLTVARVEQKYLSVEPWDKRDLLRHLLTHEEPETTLVFCRTKATVHKVTQYLCSRKIAAREIHGDLHQRHRNQVMESMRQGELDVLIASDLAARGLDIEHISHVINYDLPEDPEIYIHRIGRTARAGRQGIAWSFVTSEEGQRLTEIEKLTGVLIEKMDYPDFNPGPVPQDIRDQRNRESAQLADRDSRHRQSIVDLKQLSEDQQRCMFPGGVVPKNIPARTLGSKFRSRRSRS